MFNVFAIFAVIATTGAYVEEYSKAAEQGFPLLKRGYNNDYKAELINGVNGWEIGSDPEIITGDTILFKTKTVLKEEHDYEYTECGKFEGVRINAIPFCKMTHFGFRFSGTISEKVRQPDKKPFPGISIQSSFGSSASTPLLAGFNAQTDDDAKTYLEIIVLFKYKFFQGPPTGLLLVFPVFQLPASLAGQSMDALRDWAIKEARVGVLSPISSKHLKKLHESKAVSIINLAWLNQVFYQDVRHAGIHNSGMGIYSTRPLLLPADVIDGIIKLARKYLTVRKTENEKPTFTKSFLTEILRLLSDATAIL